MRNDLSHLNINISKPSRQDGFSILEAIVAMAILAIAFIPFVQLQGQLIRSVESFDRADIRMLANDNALAFLRERNFLLQESGQIQLGDIILKWDSDVLKPARRVYDKGGSYGRFEITLYDVEAELMFPDGASETLSLRGLGWKPLRSVIDF